MSIKISVVQEKVSTTINQYNIDEFYINESYGSIDRFNQILNGEKLRNNEISLVEFLSDIRPNNVLNSKQNASADNFKIKYGY